MAYPYGNSLYPKFKQALLDWNGAGLSAALDLASGSTLKVALVSVTTGTTGNNYVMAATDQFFSAVPSGSIVAAGVALSTKASSVSGTSAVMTAGSVTFPSVTQSGSQKGEALVIYNDTGTASTSALVAYLDTETGLPVTPNGANITMNFSSNVISLA